MSEDHEPRTTLSDRTQVYPEHRNIIPAGPRAGQQEGYVVLAQEEIDKGFVRPLRYSYIHVGPPGPTFPLQDLTEEQRQHIGDTDWVKYEPYPKGHRGSALGRYWSQADLDRVNRGCCVKTTMATTIAETYARNPHFYGSTFCCGCGTHRPVGERGEFVWDGTNERVGT